ncbi:MAG: prepilin-type N-terminal cleavage/methylation domain-containing protein [Phycisphaera sp.]|nr:prepilin-type N-terminal cleavage/methylation domain-containing protein [Phycisphaera sp.]
MGTHTRVTRGFTIIELLVVCSIITLLLAILLPSIQRAQAVAEDAKCRAQLRQFHSAMTAYAGDNFTVLPGSLEWVRGAQYSFGPSWWEHTNRQNITEGLIYNYVGRQDDVYLCPTFRGVYNTTGRYKNRVPLTGYSMNGFFHGYGPWLNVPPMNRMSRIAAPSRLMLIGEDAPWPIPNITHYALNDCNLAVGQYRNPAHLVDSLGSIHFWQNGDPNRGVADMAFVDGHVDSAPPSQSKEVAWPDDYK